MLIENFLLIVNQVGMLFLLAVVGYVLAKVKLITKDGTQQITNVLLFAAIPATIIKSFDMPFDRERLFWMSMAALIIALIYVLGILISMMFFNKENDMQRPVYKATMIYPNCTFIALPIVLALVGEAGVFYVSIYATVHAVFLWTHCVMLMTGRQGGVSAKNLLNPGMIATGIGVALFFSPFRLPGAVRGAANVLSGISTPLAMIIIGEFIAGKKLLSIFIQKKIYFVTFIRLIVIPLIVMVVLRYLQIPDVMRKACLIGVSAPTAITVVMVTARFSRDAELASDIAAFCTLCSVITLPLLLVLVI